MILGRRERERERERRRRRRYTALEGKNDVEHHVKNYSAHEAPNVNFTMGF